MLLKLRKDKKMSNFNYDPVRDKNVKPFYDFECVADAPRKEKNAMPSKPVVQGKPAQNTDAVEVSNQPATEADKELQANRKENHQNNVNEVNQMKDKALARRQKIDPKFEKNCAELDAARADYDALLEEYNRTNAEYNKVHKKSITFSKKAKEAKKANRETSIQNRETVKAALAKARERMIAAEKAFGSDKDLKAANQYLLEQAEKDGSQKMKQRAARYQADTFYDRTEEGQKAKLENARKAARGDADHKLSKAERKERARNGYAEEIGGTSVRYASLDQKRSERDYQQLLKEQALEKIVIGDKDSYKKQKRDDKNGKPTVTYMSEKTYNAAREYAASKGVALPPYKKGLELTGQQMKDYQQVMLDAASDFGDRADISERKRISDNFKDISFVTTKNMFKAANIDVQLRHNTAAAVAGTLAGLATGGSLVEEATRLVSKIIPGGGGVIDNIADHTQHGTTTDAVITTPEGYNKFNVGNALKHAGAGLAAAALVKLLDHEIGLLKKGKTLEDVVYNTIDQDVPAFKNCTPNAKKKMAKFIANPDMTSEQKLAILEKAMGTGKLNPRELTSAINQLDKYKPEENAPTVDDVNEGEKRTRYIIKNGDIRTPDNKPVKDTDLVDEYGKPFDIKGQGAQGAAVDPKISARTGKPTIAKNVDFTHNPNNKGDLSQIIISDEDGEVTDVTGNNLREPDSFTLNDNSNGKEHRNSYNFRKLSADEISKNKLDPAKAPYYTLVSAKGPNAKDIGKSIGKVFSYTFAEKKEEVTAHIAQNGEIVEDVIVEKHTPQYLLDAATMIGSSSPVYIKTGVFDK